MHYGIAFKGSKGGAHKKLAEGILELLPSGERLIDLFGGGAAISHCAVVNYPDKWKEIIYNDIDDKLVEWIEKNVQDPDYFLRHVEEVGFVSRERFLAEKENDGYIKYCWSFGVNGAQYFCNREIEPQFRDKFEATLKYYKRESDKWLGRYEPLQMTKRYQQLKDMASKVSFNSYDYKHYFEKLIKPGDVIYCDIPYPGTVKYPVGDFDYDEFVEIVKASGMPVYYSGYPGLEGEVVAEW